MSKIVFPFHYLIYRRSGVDWFVKDNGRVFYNPTDEPTQLTNRAEQFGTTDQNVAIELFRINGGKPGYYLANLRDKKYYYCGQKWEDVKAKLKELGIGRDEPSSS